MPATFRKASEVKPKPPDFVWPGRIPYGAVTVLDGDPGTNKSTLVADIAARLSTGRPMWNCDPPADKPPKPEPTIILNPEDNAGTTRSRLEAAGANLDLVHLYDPNASDADGSLLLPTGEHEFADAIRQRSIQLVVIDPLSAFADRSLQSEGSARKIMSSLGRIAARTGAAILVVRHLTKSVSGNVLHHGLGSVAISAVARSCLRLVVDPADPRRRILVHVKCSFGPLARSVCFQPIERNATVAVEYIDYHDLSPADLDLTSARPRPQLEEAMRIIFHVLRCEKQPVRVCRDALKQAGISNSTRERAKRIMGIHSTGTGFGSNLRWFWGLPESNPVVDRMRQAETDELADHLFHGDDYIDDDEDDEGDVPVA